ncbi:hypothetical protein HDU98_002003 [Podochytrium sp. JEL0797]|nr:hypothetical protein HDU98_002003 [Podochytrium sp. JEL0797]
MNPENQVANQSGALIDVGTVHGILAEFTQDLSDALRAGMLEDGVQGGQGGTNGQEEQALANAVTRLVQIVSGLDAITSITIGLLIASIDNDLAADGPTAPVVDVSPSTGELETGDIEYILAHIGSNEDKDVIESIEGILSFTHRREYFCYAF